MLTVALLVLAAAAALIAVAAWYLRTMYPAAAVDDMPAIARRPLPTDDCAVARGLQMASAAGPAGSGTARGSGGAPTRKKPTGPSRRRFLRNSMAAAGVFSVSGFAAASLGFLWPDLRGGFGATLDAGSQDEILDFIRTEEQPFEFAPGRAYLVEYTPDEDTIDEYGELTNGAQVMALFWTCVHLGCKVPWCISSQWLECGCHGSGYNRWGEYQEGPAPRGLDRFAVELDDAGNVMIDTSEIITGPPRGTASLQQPREGPSCI
jgi:cytochrome b6-f complex iron-sulfur subunit